MKGNVDILPLAVAGTAEIESQKREDISPSEEQG